MHEIFKVRLAPPVCAFTRRACPTCQLPLLLHVPADWRDVQCERLTGRRIWRGGRRGKREQEGGHRPHTSVVTSCCRWAPRVIASSGVWGGAYGGGFRTRHPHPPERGGALPCRPIVWGLPFG